MASYVLHDMKSLDPICVLQKDEIQAILLDSEKIDFRKISSGYLKAVKINGEWYRISRK